MDPLISVIVPVYNVEMYLDACVTSIVQQTYRNLEIILVDDGSTDRSGELCERWMLSDSRIHVIHQANCGLSAARNAGLDAANGALIAFVDSDDLLDLKCYENLYRCMTQFDVPVVQCDYLTFEGDWNTPKSRQQPEHTLINRERIFEGIEVNFVVAWNKLYRRELFRTLRYPVGRCHEDEFVAHHLLWEAEDVAWLHEVLYFYRRRAGSITMGSITLRTLDGLDAIRDRIEFCMSLNRFDLVSYSLDTLLAATERLYFQKDAFSSDVWDTFCEGITKDARRWKTLENRGQKRRWFWLQTTPELCRWALQCQKSTEKWLVPLKNMLKTWI